MKTMVSSPLPFSLVEMLLAILELRDPQADSLGTFAGQLFDRHQLLAQFARVFHLCQESVRNLLVLMQEVQHLFPDFGDQFGSDLRVAKLVFGLRLKHRFLQTDGDGPHHAFADVIAIVLAFGILVDGLQEPLAESAEVGATIRGVLPVDKREEGLTGASLAVGEAEFQCLGAEIEGG